jgi:hypothetical protein
MEQCSELNFKISEIEFSLNLHNYVFLIHILITFLALIVSRIIGSFTVLVCGHNNKIQIYRMSLEQIYINYVCVNMLYTAVIYILALFGAHVTIDIS